MKKLLHSSIFQSSSSCSVTCVPWALTNCQVPMRTRYCIVLLLRLTVPGFNLFICSFSCIKIEGHAMQQKWHNSFLIDTSVILKHELFHVHMDWSCLLFLYYITEFKGVQLWQLWNIFFRSVKCRGRFHLSEFFQYYPWSKIGLTYAFLKSSISSFNFSLRICLSSRWYYNEEIATETTATSLQSFQQLGSTSFQYFDYNESISLF